MNIMRMYTPPTMDSRASLNSAASAELAWARRESEIPGKFTLARLVESAAQPESPPLLCDHLGAPLVPRHELLERVETLQQRLQEQGAVPGSVIASSLASPKAAVLLMCAAAMGAMWFFPLHTRLPLSERDNLARRSRALLVATETDDDAICLRPPPEPLRAAPAGPPRLLDESGGWLMQTSGSSGPARIAALSSRALHVAAHMATEALNLQPGERWLAPMPLFHVGGLSILTRAMASRGTALVAPGFSIEDTRAAFAATAIHGISLVPTMLLRLLDNDVRPPPTLRMALIGGSAAPSELLARALDAGWPLLPTYGATEAASQIATLQHPLDDPSDLTVGPALPGVRVRIDNPDSEGRGEILVRTPACFSGYLDDSASTQCSLQGEELRTGDIGSLDDRGHLRVHGRMSALIISGGENVHPERVEAVLASHPAIAAVCVLGVSDREWGERVAAAIVPASHTPRPSREVLVAWCRERLGGHECPREWLVLDALPLLSSGKPDRQTLRKRFDKA